MSGLSTDARIRDFNELAGYSPVFYCSGEAAQSGSHGLMPVAVNVPVSLRGTTIVPGDYNYADRVAAVVIPGARIDRVLELSSDIEGRDKAFPQTIRARVTREIGRGGNDGRYFPAFSGFRTTDSL